MRVVLLEKLVNYGEFGDIVRVRPGYARNFLLPRGRALLATKENLKYFEERRQHLREISREEKQRAQARAERFAAVRLSVRAQADSDGKLYGSVSVREIIEAAKSAGLELKRNEVIIPPRERIRHTGEYEIRLNLHHDVEAAARVEVSSIAS